MYNVTLSADQANDNFIAGTSGADNLQVTVSNANVNAYAGNDTVSVNSSNAFVLAEEGDDLIYVSRDKATVFGDGGKDSIHIRTHDVYADGGVGDDLFYIREESKSNPRVYNVTLVGGDGTNTFEIAPDAGSDSSISAIIKDFKSNDSLKIDDNSNRLFSFKIDDDNVIISDNLVYSSDEDGNITTATVTPQFDITLAGIDDVSSIASVKCGFYNSTGDSLKVERTLGELYTIADGAVIIDPDDPEYPDDPTPSEPVSLPTGLTLTGDTLKVSSQFKGELWFRDNNIFTDDDVEEDYSELIPNVVYIDASGSNAKNILTGNTKNNSIYAGTSGSTLWGGGSGKNTLKGQTTGVDYFAFTGGTNDVVQNFTAGVSATSDVIYLSKTSLTSAEREADYINLAVTGNKTLKVYTSASSDEIIQYTTDGVSISGAKIAQTNKGTEFTFKDNVNYYKGSTEDDTLNFASQDSKEIYLDSSKGIVFDGVENINASESTGYNSLAGDSNSNQIIAGSGGDNLWGGLGNVADTLIGGSGSDMFWIGKTEGSDLVNNAETNDTVHLYDVTVHDVTSTSAANKNVMVNLAGGSVITVSGSDTLSATFQLADGTNWKYNHSTNAWQQNT